MPPSSTEPYIEDEIHLRDYLRVLVWRRFLILGIACIAAITVAIITLLQPNIYQSKANLLPLGQSGGDLRIALGLLGRQVLGSFLPSTRGSSDRIVAILKSPSLAENVIQRLDLFPVLFTSEWDAEKQEWQTDEPPTLEDAVKALQELVSIMPKRYGIITIAVEHTDPELAAAIANQHVDSLQRTLNDKAFSLAKKNRVFIEERLRKTRQDLATAEEALRRFEQKHKIIALEAQTAAAVNAIATIQAEIMAKEVKLGVAQRLMTGASREVFLIQEEIQGLRAQLARLGQGTDLHPPATTQNDLVFPSFDETPEIKLQYVRLQREAKIQNKLFTLLAEQLELSKIAESRDETAFQVLDEAFASKHRVKPKRRLSVMLATTVGAFVGIFLAFLLEYLSPTVRTREQVERQIGTALLATIPPVPHQRSRWRRRARSMEADLVLHHASEAPVMEAFRYLYTRLTRLHGGRGIQTVLFTSVQPDQNGTTVLANLALVAAHSGTKTLLVDSNARQPALHRLLQCPLMPGLADILADPESWQKGIQATHVHNLHLIPAGTMTPTTFVSIESSAFDALLARFKETYDLILCASPPVPDFTDAGVFSGKIEATCLVLTCGGSRVEASVEAKAALEAVQANVIGAILTDYRV